MPKLQRTIPLTVVVPVGEMQFDVKPNNTVGEINDIVCKMLNIRQKYFFGLKIEEAGTFKWLKMEKKVEKYKRDDKLFFIFDVKVYFIDVSQVIEESSQIFFYYKIKHLILTGELFCPMDTALGLGSLQVVIDNGSILCESGTIAPNKYIPERLLQQYSETKEELREKLFELYARNRDLPKEEAIVEYDKLSQDLPGFGVVFFEITNPRKTPLLLGVGPYGLSIYPHNDKINPKINFQWHELKHVKYNDTKLTIRPADASKDLWFICKTRIDCENILHLCMEYHEFHRAVNSPDSIDIQQMKLEAKEREDARKQRRQLLLKEREEKNCLQRRLEEARREMQEKDAAIISKQELVSQMEGQLEEMRVQLMQEKMLRQKLDSTKEKLEAINECLMQEKAQSAEERCRLEDERNKLLSAIKEQELEKKAMEEKRTQQTTNHNLDDANQCDELDDNAIELKSMKAPPEDHRVEMMGVDDDFIKHLEILGQELSDKRKLDKMEKVDVDFEVANKNKVDKYKTLKNIRSGNTKQRVEQFESM